MSSIFNELKAEKMKNIIEQIVDDIERLQDLRLDDRLTDDGYKKLQDYKIALKVVKNITYEPLLAPVFYTDDYLKWLNKYFVKVDKVFEYCRANKKEYFTKEQLHKKYKKAMLESPFK